MNLSKRLQSIASMVDYGYTVADIGTDHALLPIELVSSGICPCAIAMDINKGPLTRAMDNISSFNLSDKIVCRLSDGLDKLETDEVDCAVIAGMGGDLISNIISKHPDKVKTLVLSPHTHFESVRSALRNHNYRISDENMIKEDGKYYVIIKAEKTDFIHSGVQPEYFDYFGEILIKNKNSILKEFLLKEHFKYISIKQKQHYISLVNSALNEFNAS